MRYERTLQCAAGFQQHELVKLEGYSGGCAEVQGDYG